MPIKTQTKKNIGATGVADIRVLNSSVRVIFADGDTYEVSKEKDFKLANGKYNVTLNPLGDRILFMSPPPLTTHLVQFKEFSNRGQNGIPEPKIQRGGPRTSKNGGSYYAPDELKAIAKLLVVGEGPYVGLEIVYSFTYAFENDPGTQNTLINATQARLIAIEEFLRINGIDFLQDDIPFSTNVLPWLEKKFLAAGKVYQVSLNDKGYVKQITEVPEYLLPKNLTSKKGSVRTNAPLKTPAKKAKK